MLGLQCYFFFFLELGTDIICVCLNAHQRLKPAILASPALGAQHKEHICYALQVSYLNQHNVIFIGYFA